MVDDVDSDNDDDDDDHDDDDDDDDDRRHQIRQRDVDDQKPHQSAGNDDLSDFILSVRFSCLTLAM